jgi:hypothetical protein
MATTTYQYKHVEQALAETIGINTSELPAFRARLRHLRNLGLLTKSNPGSGKTIRYTENDILEVLLALEAQLLGLPPRLAVSFVRGAGHDLIKKTLRASEAGKRFTISAEPHFGFDPERITIFGSTSERTDGTTHRRTSINLATSVSLLMAALRRATGELRTPADIIFSKKL